MRLKKPRDLTPRGFAFDLATPAAARTSTPSAGTAAPAPRSAGAALRLRPRLVDDKVAVTEQSPVQHLDRLGRFFLRRHFDEPESSRAPRELIRNDTNRFDGPGLRKQFSQIFFCGLKGEIADE